ncbi:DUF6879 family protein [Streptomyces litchfieldiae]|uniref:DUF6879 domain-containing protein n=1 Tax=Streptomyces litchfieldiae TaxID=3075543 RepID=A0ABU2MM47_9ACTN|nr:DUF6879 family protein [Streptomyces sp. DSM 44938]MDT0342693.1 hypothetical protein [Streptomyces sp. DSM 44938]
MGKLPTFEELFRGCERSAVHLEMRDGYMRSDPAFIDWSEGKRFDPADRWRSWFDIVSETTGRGVAVRRARIVSEPVSDYIRFEHEVTDGLNVASGEQVRWLPRRRTTDFFLPGNDFWVFDEHLILINHFDGNGDSLEHEFSEDADLADLLSRAFEAVWDRAVPHASYRLG